MRRLAARSCSRRARRRVPLVADDGAVHTERRVVDRLAIAPEQVRAWLPVHTYPVSAGVKGGFAGSVAMAVLACGYGLLKVGSIWYPINLLAAVVYAAVGETRTRRSQCVPSRQLRHRRGRARVGLHARGTALWRDAAHVPAAADRPRRTDRPGVVVGHAASDAGLLNPLLASRIDWFWFIASQMAFGIVAGSSSFGSRRCRRSKTSRSPCARASRRRERFHRGRETRS